MAGVNDVSCVACMGPQAVSASRRDALLTCCVCTRDQFQDDCSVLICKKIELFMWLRMA